MRPFLEQGRGAGDEGRGKTGYPVPVWRVGLIQLIDGELLMFMRVFHFSLFIINFSLPFSLPG